MLVLGLSYKRDVDDTRESPSFEIIRHLMRGGAEVSYSDPYVPTATVADKPFKSVPCDAASLARFDAVVVATDHRAFPWDVIARSARLIVDSRGAVPRAKVTGVLWPLSGPAVRGTAPAKKAAAAKAGGARA